MSYDYIRLLKIIATQLSDNKVTNKMFSMWKGICVQVEKWEWIFLE